LRAEIDDGASSGDAALVGDWVSRTEGSKSLDFREAFVRRDQNAFKSKVHGKKAGKALRHGHRCLAYGDGDDAIVGREIDDVVVKANSRAGARQFSAHGQRDIDGRERFRKDVARELLLV